MEKTFLTNHFSISMARFHPTSHFSVIQPDMVESQYTSKGLGEAEELNWLTLKATN